MERPIDPRKKLVKPQPFFAVRKSVRVPNNLSAILAAIEGQAPHIAKELISIRDAYASVPTNINLEWVENIPNENYETQKKEYDDAYVKFQQDCLEYAAWERSQNDRAATIKEIELLEARLKKLKKNLGKLDKVDSDDSSKT